MSTAREREFPPIALTVAGSDPSAGAGIQADLKTFAALGVYGASVLTALTAQNTRGVRAVEAVSPALVAAQIGSVFDDLAVRAVKIGMLPSPIIIHTVREALSPHRTGPVVLDPVMVATSGDLLVGSDTVAALRALMPSAALVTPNLPEAAALLDEPVANDEGTMVAQGRRLLALGCRAVLVKGGHAAGPESVDLLVEGDTVTRFGAPRINTRNTHGTGCTLSSAVAAYLAFGLALPDAVGRAKGYVSAAIAAADRLRVGTGSGPLHHFHRFWPEPSRAG